jgi:hypothetical protein
MDDPISDALAIGHKKLAELLLDRAKIDREIVEWKRVVDSLSAVSLGEEEEPSAVEISAFVEGKPGTKTIKFTDGVRLVLRQNSARGVPISVADIREKLLNLGFSLEKYAQPLVPLHNTLKRLEHQGEVRAEKNEQGQTLGYEWISPIERIIDVHSDVSDQKIRQRVKDLARLFSNKRIGATVPKSPGPLRKD